VARCHPRGRRPRRFHAPVALGTWLVCRDSLRGYLGSSRGAPTPLEGDIECRSRLPYRDDTHEGAEGIRPRSPRARGEAGTLIHPGRWLIVEVADTSLALDRLRKGRLYARAGIADYWVLNLVDEVLEVYREPVRAPSARGDWKYDSVRLLRRNSTVTPLAAPRARIRVAALLP